MNFNCPDSLMSPLAATSGVMRYFKTCKLKMFKHLDGVRVGRVEWILCLASHAEMAACAYAASGKEVITGMPVTSASHSLLVEANSDFVLENSCALHAAWHSVTQQLPSNCFILCLDIGLVTYCF